TLLPECIPPRLDDLDAHPGWCAASPACQRHAVIDPHVIAVAPSQFLQCVQERRHAPALFRIVFSQVRKHADASHVLELLRLRGSGQAAAPPRKVINSRRLIASPDTHDRPSYWLKLAPWKGVNLSHPDVRFGS